MTHVDQAQRRAGLRFNPEINAGAILQSGIVLVAIIGGYFALASRADKAYDAALVAQKAAEPVVELRLKQQEISSKVADLTEGQSDQRVLNLNIIDKLATIQAQLAGLTAQLNQMNRQASINRTTDLEVTR